MTYNVFSGTLHPTHFTSLWSTSCFLHFLSPLPNHDYHLWTTVEPLGLGPVWSLSQGTGIENCTWIGMMEILHGNPAGTEASIVGSCENGNKHHGNPMGMEEIFVGFACV